MASLYEGQGRQAAARGAARARTLEPGGHAPDGRARRARSAHVDTERARMFAHVDHQAGGDNVRKDHAYCAERHGP